MKVGHGQYLAYLDLQDTFSTKTRVPLWKNVKRTRKIFKYQEWTKYESRSWTIFDLLSYLG